MMTNQEIWETFADDFIDVCKDAARSLIGESSHRNEDVILYRNGDIVRFSYSGNRVVTKSEDIVFIYHLNGTDWNGYWQSIRNSLPKRIRERCDELGWFAVYVWEYETEEDETKWLPESECQRFEPEDDDLEDLEHDIYWHYDQNLKV